MRKHNLLFIPHTPPADTLVTRGEALAQGLASEFSVFLLAWRGVTPGRQAGPLRLAARLAGIFTVPRLYGRQKVTVVQTPFLYVRRAGMEFLRPVNTWFVNRIIKRHKIDVVINELALVDSRNLRGPHVIDIVDLPSPREIARWSRQADGAAGITTITEGLRAELAAAGMDAEVVPNGADLGRFRNAEGGAIRARLGIGDRFVIGYIGNHAEWSGLGFLLDVFKIVKGALPEACLMIVGMGSEIPRAKAKAERESIRDVVFTGPVESTRVAAYFKAIDIGVLPFELDPHAALSFPIKVIEYSAARKMVVASPLNVLKEINLPNVRVVDRRVDLWARVIIESKAAAWNDAWDAAVEAYDWSNLASRLATYIKSRIPL
jgi:glycosyltransferase involved in cell wall biosynthesis